MATIPIADMTFIRYGDQGETVDWAINFAILPLPPSYQANTRDGECQFDGRSLIRPSRAPASLHNLRFELDRPASAKLPRRSLKTLGHRFDCMHTTKTA
ncbi:hypothetical protein GA0061099_103032 [Bradyrhizobium yuanmingense]|uniref:Uncharacterized protein n=1 Tax=Bradyrhizobium yuanmingense TaxID=108015 RepID=A0A1C3XJ73_9BRAD|nr:hypothetical protein IQ15_07373 [Bradyrhizobium yuanmingense]SCB52310.1 hypothetical protein GA0061099_103032 [Bradyrhizobium yuanmingense]